MEGCDEVGSCVVGFCAQIKLFEQQQITVRSKKCTVFIDFGIMMTSLLV
jgi:hypothetical protein